MLRIFWYTPFSILFPGMLKKRSKDFVKLFTPNFTYTSQLIEGYRDTGNIFYERKNLPGQEGWRTSRAGEN